MLPHRYNQNQQPNQTAKRKCKEGDWVCIRCSNYNYSFRNICKYGIMLGNRCRVQSKEDNKNAIAMLYNENYGENSFPSALFITLDPLKAK